MTPEEILQGLYDETLVGNGPEVLDLTRQALELGMEPQSLLFDALIPSLEEVGARFERGDFFVPEMLIAGRAMAGAMEVLRPLLAETGVQTIGTFLMGTVKGDVHDIGKNLVNIMLEGAGFEVIDLGVQVAPETFVAKITEHQPDIVGFSAFLTTTMPMFKANINALEKAGMGLDSIDVIESNEAFAAQAIAVARGLELDMKKVNPNGGAIALGHPIGASGAVLAVKAIHGLHRTGGRYALVTMCVGGGQGIAAVFERL